MMLRWILLLTASVCAGAASLTFWRAPTKALWKVAILSGEFGYGLSFVALVIAAAAGWLGGSFLRATLILCALALVGWLHPVIEAWRIARTLPTKLTEAFGPVTMERGPFALPALFSGKRGNVPVETREVAPGLPMDFYRAVGREGPAPCVLMIHGGGWDSGDRTQLPALNHHLAQRGYAVAAVSYRLAPETRWPGQADDIAAAIAYLKNHSTALGIDASRLVLMGRSAGGQLATAVAYGRPDPAIRGAISFYGPHDLEFAWRFSREDDILNAVKLLRQYLGGSPETAPDAYRTASAYLTATAANAVPTLFVHGRQDSMVWHKQSERMHAKLDSLGVPNAFVSLPWATHACDFNSRGPSGQLAWYAVDWFLAAVTK